MSHRTKASESKTSRGVGSRINNFDQNKLSHKHLDMGNVSKKIPIPLSDGRTIIFVSSREDVDRVKAFWEERIKHIQS